jgi:hypothetical protein
MTLTCRCGGLGLSRRVCLRACLWCDGSGERGAGRHVPDVRVECDDVSNRGCVVRAM